MSGRTNLPDTSRSPIAERETRLPGALRQFVGRLIVDRVSFIPSPGGELPTNSFAVIVVQEHQPRSDDIECPDV